jgi:hypothetical protein
MKKTALVAVACAALATPALASDHTTVTVVLKNTAFVSQGGNGHGQAAVAMIAQGAIATIQAPHNLPTVIINTGFVPIGAE